MNEEFRCDAVSATDSADELFAERSGGAKWRATKFERAEFSDSKMKMQCRNIHSH